MAVSRAIRCCAQALPPVQVKKSSIYLNKQQQSFSFVRFERYLFVRLVCDSDWRDIAMFANLFRHIANSRTDSCRYFGIPFFFFVFRYQYSNNINAIIIDDDDDR